MGQSDDGKGIVVLYGDFPITARAGQRLLDSILSAGIDHRRLCGGHGFCTSCRVRIVAGNESLSPVSALERDRLGSAAGALRLACQTSIFGPVEVRVPPAGSSKFSLRSAERESG